MKSTDGVAVSNSDMTQPLSPSDDDLLISYAKGEMIFAEGEAGDDMYIVETGEVEIIKSCGPSERRLAVLGPGDFFGEVAILEEIPRMATARAQSDCRLLPIGPVTFDQLLRDHPEITVRVLRKLSSRLREIEEVNQRAHAAALGALAGGAAKKELEPIDPVGLQPAERRTSKPQLPGAFATGKLPTIAADDSVAEGTVADHLVASSVDLLASSGIAIPDPPLDQTIARLVHLETGSAFPVAPGAKNLIGRFDPMTGKYPQIDLQSLDAERSLSRRHARIWMKDGKYFLREEVGVGNGTFRQDHRLAAGEDYEIRDGNRLRFGLIELIFQVADGTPIRAA